MTQPGYGRVGRFLSRQVWAIQEHVLDTMVEVVRMRASGITMSQEEIRARIGAARDNGVRTGAAVAVLPLQGVIGPKMNMFMEISGGTSIEQFMRSFRELRDDPSVTAIVCDVDSPGGSVFLLREAFDEIFAARAVKPTVAVVRPICGSAALFIASAFDEIVCTPSGEVGSIGCYMVHEDWSKANEMAGVKPTYISYGDHKVEGNPDEPLSDEALSYLTASVTESGQDFEKAVAKGRGVSVNYVRENFGQGRMLTAKQAKAVGMVDRVATFEETLARLTSGRGARNAKAADATLVSMTEASPVDLRAEAAALQGVADELRADAPAPAADETRVDEAPLEAHGADTADAPVFTEVERTRMRLELEEHAVGR